jgi:hypothetical protein
MRPRRPRRQQAEGMFAEITKTHDDAAMLYGTVAV